MQTGKIDTPTDIYTKIKPDSPLNKSYREGKENIWGRTIKSEEVGAGILLYTHILKWDEGEQQNGVLLANLENLGAQGTYILIWM